MAINEALHQMMSADRSVFIMGQGVKSPWYVGQTTKGLLDRFGTDRVIDTPVSENAVTGAAVGAAIAGMKPIVVHPRMDFMMYAMDPIINEAANWSYMFGGRAGVSMVVWGIINRGGEQAAQHSQAFHAFFAHVPGLKVVMPYTPYDAKGLMISAIRDNNPVVFIDDRWLYNIEGDVPENMYNVPLGEGIVRKKGRDVTLAAVSYMVGEALKAGEILEDEGISLEVIDLRSVKPLDKEILFKSVKKTGRLVVADIGWRTCGLSSEISSLVSENMFRYLKMPVRQIALPDIPAPASSSLEKVYYPSYIDIVDIVKNSLKGEKKNGIKSKIC